MPSVRRGITYAQDLALDLFGNRVKACGMSQRDPNRGKPTAIIGKLWHLRHGRIELLPAEVNVRSVGGTSMTVVYDGTASLPRTAGGGRVVPDGLRLRVRADAWCESGGV